MLPLSVHNSLLAFPYAARLLKTTGDPTDEQKQFLRTFDLRYGHRRLAFVVGRMNHFYGLADRETLNVLKHRLYDLIAELGTVLEQPDAAFLPDAVDRICGEQRIGPYLPDWRLSQFVQSVRPEIDELRVQ